MAKKPSSILGTVLSLLLIIPAAYGIYYGIKYITPKVDPETENKLGVDIYVDGNIVTDITHTQILENVGNSVNVEFKQPGSADYYENNIIVTPNQEAQESLAITDAFDSEQFVNTKIVILEKTYNARILFSDSNYSWSFSLKLTSELTLVTNIEVPDIIFYE